MAARHNDRDRDIEGRYAHRTRLAWIALIVAALVVGALFVRWVNQGVGMGNVGEYYRQADEIEGR